MSRYSDTLTYEAILNEMLAQVPDTVDKREGSVIYDALAPAAMELAQVYILLDVIFDETFVDTASLQYLMKRATEIGVPIQEATQAVVRGEFRPKSLEIPEGTRFNCGAMNYVVEESPDTCLYRLVCTENGEAGNLSSGELIPTAATGGINSARIGRLLKAGTVSTKAEIIGDFSPANIWFSIGKRFECGGVFYIIAERLDAGACRMICETAGSAGNLASGTLLPIDSIRGLETAEIAGVLIPAVDTDNADTLRERYYRYVRRRPFGGNIAHYKQWLETPDEGSGISGVGGVKVYPVWDGIGTVKVQFIAAQKNAETDVTDYVPPNDGFVSAVQEYLDPVAHHGEGYGIAPVGHTVTVEGVKGESISVSCSVTFSEGTERTAEDAITEALEPYLLELRKSWADEEETVVKVSQIVNRIMELDDVLDVDIASVTINGQSGNYTLASGYVPVMPGEGDET